MAKEESQRFYGTGRRKSSVARVWVKVDSEFSFVVNGKPFGSYFILDHVKEHALEPVEVLKLLNSISISATVTGGGFSGQAGALRLGISRALQALDPTCRPMLKKEGLLRRDSRIVQRKLYGRKKARKSPQFSKR